MAGGKQTPRQKMIGIMYLVLLGMIALSISDSILQAFRTLTESLETSTQNVQTGIDATFASFEATKLKEEPARATPIYNSAKQAKALTDSLDIYVSALKKRLEDEGGGYDPERGDLRKRDDLDIANRIMITEGKGVELKQKINATREKLIALLDEKDRKSINFSLQASDPKKQGLTDISRKSWEQASFGDGVPLTAAITALAKIRADIKNAESEMVKKILGKMDIAVVNLDQFAAVAVAPTSYVIKGEPYTAEIFLTAYDSQLNSSVSVNGASLPVKDGKGSYTVNTNNEGVFKWTGTVRVKQTDGTIKEYKTPEQTYQVASPSAVVSPDKMNVFYVGVDNPVSVSAPGIAKEKIRISVAGGTSTGSNGKYMVTVAQADIGKTANVTVSAEINGKVQSFGTSTFRIKRIPDPRPKFVNRTGGAASSVLLKTGDRLYAILEGFDFDTRFAVTRFDMTIQKPRADAQQFKASSALLTPQMIQALNAVTPGTRLFFDNIVSVGPDGVQRPLDGIVFTAN